MRDSLLKSEGFLCLQRSPWLCSCRYLWWQIILNVLCGSQLLHQESTSGSSCMLNSLHIQKELNLLNICLPEGHCACVFTAMCVCVSAMELHPWTGFANGIFHPPFNLPLSSFLLCTQKILKTLWWQTSLSAFFGDDPKANNCWNTPKYTSRHSDEVAVLHKVKVVTTMCL